MATYAALAALFIRKGNGFEPTELTKILVIYSPGGIEKFFAEAGEAAPARELPPPLDGPPDVERLSAIAAKHGMEIHAPQPA